MLVWPGYEVTNCYSYICLYASIPRSCGVLVYAYSWEIYQCMVIYGFTLRYANILVIPEVVECLHMSIAESHMWNHIYIYIYIWFHMSIQGCVYLISYEAFLKRKHHINSSCYGKRKVEKRRVGSLQNLVSFILLSL